MLHLLLLGWKCCDFQKHFHVSKKIFCVYILWCVKHSSFFRSLVFIAKWRGFFFERAKATQTFPFPWIGWWQRVILPNNYDTKTHTCILFRMFEFNDRKLIFFSSFRATFICFSGFFTSADYLHNYFLFMYFFLLCLGNLNGGHLKLTFFFILHLKHLDASIFIVARRLRFFPFLLCDVVIFPFAVLSVLPSVCSWRFFTSIKIWYRIRSFGAISEDQIKCVFLFQTYNYLPTYSIHNILHTYHISCFYCCCTYCLLLSCR